MHVVYERGHTTTISPRQANVDAITSAGMVHWRPSHSMYWETLCRFPPSIIKLFTNKQCVFLDDDHLAHTSVPPNQEACREFNAHTSTFTGSCYLLCTLSICA